MAGIINRQIALIRPRKPFLEWINNLPGKHPELTLERLQHDCPAYLIPECASPEEGSKYVQKKFSEIFEMELWAWHTDETYWPKKRNLALFREWFDIEIHSEVIDMDDDEDFLSEEI